ncbi:MAG: hypothetical protein HY701_02300 [Gemmatimonadetes bacterium]|nr:hypothetical protein [Gemmatimonadota bacterium]
MRPSARVSTCTARTAQLAAPIVLVILAALAVFPATLRAEAYMSVRTGLRCSQCHVNRTGGGGRTAFGSIYAQTRLAMRQGAFRPRSLGDAIAMSANFRVAASGTVSESTPRTAVEIAEANVQLELRLVPDVLAFYVDETMGPGGAAAREAFALVAGLPFAGYVKAGKFLLPYGLRLVDNSEFIRERTGFSYNTPDQGIELGLEPGPLSLFFALSNGTQGAGANKSEKQLTGSAALIYPRFRLGVSASRNDGPRGQRDVAGGFAAFNLGRFTVLSELDRVVDSFATQPDVEQLAAYVQGDFLATQGLNLKVTYGYLDPSQAVPENEKVRMRFGLESFPLPFLQMSAFYTLLEDIPQATTDLDRLSVELHVHF